MSENETVKIISDFLSVMADMSVSQGTDFSNRLLNSSDADFLKHINGYLENRSLTAQIATDFYAEDFKGATDKTLEYMKTELEKLGMEVPEDFSLSGTISAEAFGEAFTHELEGQLENIRGMIMEFNSGLSSPQSTTPPTETSGESAPASVVYNQNFNVGTTKETSFEQITAWKRALLLAKLRG